MVFEDPWTQRIHEETLRTVLFCAIHGQYSSSSFQYVQSTAERGNRYLEQTNGDPEKAFQECEEYNYSWWASFVNALWASIPLLGIFTSVSRPTWRALRDLSLIAYLNGYDLMDSEVQQKILDCLATPYLRSVAASATTGATVQVLFLICLFVWILCFFLIYFSIHFFIFSLIHLFPIPPPK